MITLLAALVIAPQSDFPIGALGIGNVSTVEGKQVRISAPGTKGTVLFFIATDCPIANRYAPEMARIAKEYGQKGFVFLRVYPESRVTPEKARTHGKDFSLTSMQAVIDAKHYLVGKIRPKVTPEAALVGVDGRLLYRGRIDDTYMDHGRFTETPTRRDLREALDDVVAGRAVRLRHVPAVGCDIPPIR